MLIVKVPMKIKPKVPKKSHAQAKSKISPETKFSKFWPYAVLLRLRMGDARRYCRSRLRLSVLNLTYKPSFPFKGQAVLSFLVSNFTQALEGKFGVRKSFNAAVVSAE